MGKVVKSVLALFTLRLGKSGHIREESLSWTLSQCRASPHDEEREKGVMGPCQYKLVFVCGDKKRKNESSL